MKFMKHLPVIPLVLALMIALSPFCLFGQVNLGAIKGETQDVQHARVPNVQLTLTNEETGVVQTTTSSEAGEFNILHLAPGVYSLKAEAPGFKVTLQQHVVVSVGSTVSLTIALAVGQVQQTVTVSAQSGGVETETSDVGTAITPEEIRDLPVPMTSDMRNPLSFVTLTPGVSGAAPSGEPDYRLHVSGSPSDSTEVYIDGIPVANTAYTGFSSYDHPPIDAISEFKLANNNQSAQLGLSSSAVSFAFRSGTNHYHGRLFEFLQNDKLNANDYVSNALHQSKAPLKQNEYGATFGGPVRLPHLYNGIDKTFFFVEWTGFNWRPSSNNATLTTFPNKYRSGDFSQALGAQLTVNGNLVYDPLGRPVYKGEIYDPKSVRTVTSIYDGKQYQIRDPYPDNVIPTTAFSSIANKVLASFPMATTDDIQNNFFRVQATTNDEYRFVLKLDHTINSRHSISGSAFLGTYKNGNNGSLNELSSDVINAPFKHFRFSYTYMHSPQTINTFNFGFLRDYYVGGPSEYGPGLEALGINGLPNQIGSQPYPGISLLGALSTGIGGVGVQANAENRFIENDNLTLIRGHHIFSLGGEVRRLQRNENATNAASFTFDAPETGLNGIGFASGSTVSIPTGTGNSGASFLAGAVDLSYNTFPISQGYRWLQGGVYAMDDWKVTPKLVLNLGVRYDIQVPRSEVNSYISTVNPLLPNPSAGNLPGAYTFYGQGTGRNGKARIGNTDFKAFQPRIGFAFSPFTDQTTAIRGGFAMTRPTGNDNLENGIGSNMYSVGFSGTAISSKPGDSIGSPAFYWDNGFPASGVTGANLNPGQLVGMTNPAIIHPSAGLSPTQINWTLQVQQQLPSKMIATLGYVGAHSYHIGVWSKPNEINPASVAKYKSAAESLDIPFNQFFDQPINSIAAQTAGISAPWSDFSSAVGSAAATVGQALRPFPQYGSVDNPINPIGSVSYNGLQTSLQKHYANGLTYLLSYTFSKTIGNADALNGVFGGAENAIYAGSFYQDYYNPRAERSVTSSDIPQVVALSYTYELPVGKGKRFMNRGGIANAVLGGWQVAGIHQYQSGRPIHIEYDAIGGSTNPYRATDGYSFRTDVTGQALKNPNYHKNCSGPSSVSAFHQECSFFINPEAFSAPAAGDFGTAPHFFSNLRLPNFFNENLSAEKRFTVFRESQLQFQANFFNAFNRVVFSNGGNANTFIFNNAPSSLDTAATSSSVFGLWTAQQNAPRIIQFALKLEF